MAIEREHRKEPSGTETAFASDGAFVVQLDRGIDPGLTRFAGRLEHLESGQRARFGSVEELLAAIKRFLATAKGPHD